MISYDVEGGRFNFRSVAVIISKGHVLIHRAEDDNFWALPGGRVELFENSNDTVVREIKEELGLSCEVVRQLWYVENFFECHSTRFHELSNYFLVDINGLKEFKSEIDSKGIETSVNLLFRWVPLDSLIDYNLKPEFLHRKLHNLPASLEQGERIKINL